MIIEFRPSSLDCPERGTPGFTLVELMAAITIMLLLTTMAIPLARNEVKRSRELELRRDLRDIRTAIDRYKDYADQQMFQTKPEQYNYPPDLDTLVEGVEMKGTKPGVKYKFLRRIPVDPMTGKADWGLRAMQDDPDSTSWGGDNVFDVYTKSTDTALDGTKYSDW
jgi:general secretion pathway protein G